MSKNKESGQGMVLFGVLMGALIAIGSILAINLVVLVGQIDAINDILVSAAAGGAAQSTVLPGARGLDEDRAQEVARHLLRRNLQEIPFLDAPAVRIAGDADILVIDPSPGLCEPDPFEAGVCYQSPFVTIRVVVPVRLAWGEIVLDIPMHAAAQAGQTP